MLESARLDADKGDANAQYRVALMLERGVDKNLKCIVEKNEEEAVEYYEKAIRYKSDK